MPKIMVFPEYLRRRKSGKNVATWRTSIHDPDDKTNMTIKLTGPRDAQELPRHSRRCCQRTVDACCQRGEIRVKRADDDTGVPRPLVVQANEMAAVQCQHRASFRDGVVEHLLIGGSDAGLPGFRRSLHIMSHLPQRLHCGHRKVLVGLEPRPSLRFVGANLLLNFRRMRAQVRPGVGQVLGRKRRIAAQKVGLTRAQPPRLRQQPYRDARAHDARFASAHARRGFDAGESLAQIGHHPAQHLGFLSPAQPGDLLLHLTERAHRTERVTNAAAFQLRSQSGDGKRFGLLAYDTTRVYIDAAPFPAKPVKRTCRCIYRLGDAQVGQSSDPKGITVEDNSATSVNPEHNL